MQQPSHPGPRPILAPTFYLTTRQPLSPAVLLLAIAVAVAALSAFIYGMNQVRHTSFTPDGTDSAHSARSASSHADDDKDDPNQIDTIVLGDHADAPMPARHDHHVSPVHPTIVVRLPRFGDQTGLIPNSPAGHLLYGWLFAFNHTSAGGLAEALPSAAPEAATAVQIALRHKTGGFNLLSAKEVQPGLLVFRLSDQTLQAARCSAPCSFVQTPARLPSPASASAPSAHPSLAATNTPSRVLKPHNAEPPPNKDG